MKRISWPGRGWKFVCHRCGFQFPSTEIRKEWTGLHVCQSCWEPRHEQTLIKIRGERSFPKMISPEPSSDTFGDVCNIATRSGYADLGEADCMQADNNTISYAVASSIIGNGHT